MANEVSTVLTTVKIDISPTGIQFLFEGIDQNLANLIQAAGTFTSQAPVTRTYDSADITIQSDKIISFVTPPPTP